MEATANNVAVINQQKDLEHLNKLVEEIKTIKEGYKDLKIDGTEDKDGYELVRAAIGVLRPKRTGLEAERKSVVKPYNDTVRFINSEYEKITSLLQDGPGGELELKAKKEAVDEIIQKQKEEEERQAEHKINNRINELISKGMVFDGSYYTIGDKDLEIPETSIGVVDIRTMSDDFYNNFLQMVDDKSKKITAEKERILAAEAKAKAEKEAAEKKEREEFEAQKKLMEEQQAEIKKQQDALKAQQDKLDADKRDAEQREKQAEQNRINEIIKNRSAVLVGLGMKYNQTGDIYTFEEIEIPTALVICATQLEWVEFVQDTTDKIKAKKEAAAKALEAKQSEEKKQKADADALAEKERLAGLTDKQRMQQYIDALYNVPVMEMTTKPWKNKVAMVRDFISNNRPV